MLWNPLYSMWESLINPAQEEQDTLKCRIEVTEFFLVELLLSRFINIDQIIYASRDLRKFLFPSKLMENPESKKIVDDWFDYLSKINNQVSNSQDLCNDERMSLLPLNNNIVIIVVIMGNNEYLEFLKNIQKIDYWEANNILQTQLQNMEKSYPSLLNQYFDEVNDRLDASELELFNTQFKNL